MTGTGAFLMKDVVLFAVSFYLLEQDLLRFQLGNRELTPVSTMDPREASSSPDTLKRSA
jgi:hypothetical protein